MSRPRVAVAGLQHETNTFAPLPTTYASFESGGSWPEITRGAAILARFSGANIPVAGALGADLFEPVPLLWAWAEPSGTVAQDAFDLLANEICERLAAAGPVDGVYLDLHGAMTTEGEADAEAALLARIRQVAGPDLPIAASLDLHANISAAFVRQASATAIYRSYPHIDMAETGARAARMLVDAIRHGPFARAYRPGDFIPPITAQSTMREPARSLYARIPEIEAETGAYLDLAMGFPPADIAHCGPSVVAHHRDAAVAAAAADRLRDALHAAEGEFANPLVPAHRAVRLAMAAAAEEPGKPVILCDPQDNPGAGAPGDSTGLLACLIEAKAPAALALLWAPEAAAAAHAAGQGAELRVVLGGFHQASGGPAISTMATVVHLSDGSFPFTGPMYGGATAHLGPMATLALGPVRVVVSTRRAQNADQAIFRAGGIEPAAEPILAVKSAVHFLADYEPLAARIIFAEAPGANPCNIAAIPYRRLRKGVRLGALGPGFGA